MGSKLINHEESQTGGREINWLFYKCSCEVIVGEPRTISPSCRIRGTPNHQSDGLTIVGYTVGNRKMFKNKNRAKYITNLVNKTAKNSNKITNQVKDTSKK